VVSITGNRYQFSGQKMPKFKDWAESVLGLDVNDKGNMSDPLRELQADPPIENL
jgi:alkyldihydroxyacetonephosphate synthase